MLLLLLSALVTFLLSSRLVGASVQSAPFSNNDSVCGAPTSAPPDFGSWAGLGCIRNNQSGSRSDARQPAGLMDDDGEKTGIGDEEDGRDGRWRDKRNGRTQERFCRNALQTDAVGTPHTAECVLHSPVLWTCCGRAVDVPAVRRYDALRCDALHSLSLLRQFDLLFGLCARTQAAVRRVTEVGYSDYRLLNKERQSSVPMAIEAYLSLSLSLSQPPLSLSPALVKARDVAAEAVGVVGPAPLASPYEGRCV
jgi:hypothetical protein